MSEVKRFRADHRHVVETEFDDAQYVRVEDYEALQQRLDAAEQRNDAPPAGDQSGTVTGDMARVYDVIGLHHSHPVSVLIANFENIKRFSHYLDAVEREFLMAPGEPSDDPEDAGFEPDDECLVQKFPAQSVEHYVEQFRAALELKFGCNAEGGAHIPPAGGEVEVLAWVNFDDGRRGIDYYPSVIAGALVGTELVDRAHVAQLQAEVERLKSESFEPLYNAAIDERDALQSELTKALSVLDLVKNEDLKFKCLREQEGEIKTLQSELTKARELLNTPHTDDWFEGVRLEAGRQIGRWGTEHDAGKAPADWFWLIGYLAQKAMIAQMSGDEEKARHHTISTGAAMLNWFRVIVGDSNAMRPGIDAHQSAPAAKDGEA